MPAPTTPSGAPASPETLRRLAAQMSRGGRPEQAIALYRKLLAQRPDWADEWYNLGRALWQARCFEDALDAFQRALDAGLRRAEEAHLNRAVILARDLGRPEAAEAELERALERAPRCLPALLNLGALAEQRGERESAAARYRQVLEIEPAQPLALARLPQLQRVSDPDDPLIDRLAAAIDTGRSHAERADLGFGLGKALDDVGRYDEAFAAYTAANVASREAGGAAARYDAAAHERHVDRLIEAFAKPLPRRAALAAAPLFICGMFRSGSTLTEQVLAAHPAVTAGGELDLLPEIARRHLAPGQPWPVLDDPAALDALARDYLDAVARRFPGAGLVTDKRPDNFLHVGLIKAMLPDARLIFTRRNSLDNCLSAFFLHLGHSMPWALDLADTAHWYRQHDRLLAHWQSLWPDEIHVMDYDAFVAEPEPVARRLLDFCGLPWDPACLAFHQARSLVQTASLWQVRQPLYQGSSGRWRHYERHLGPLRDALGG